DRTIGVLSQKQQQRAELADTYWQLMRSGETNTNACKVLGMSRRSGTTIRRAHHYQTPRPGAASGVVEPLPRYPGTVADRRPAPAGLLAPSDRRRAGPASVDDQTRAGSAPIP